MLENDLTGRYVPASDWVEDAERFISEMTLLANSLQNDIDVDTEVDRQLQFVWATAEIFREALKFVTASITEEWFTRDAYDEIVADLRFWAHIAFQKKLLAAKQPLA